MAKFEFSKKTTTLEICNKTYTIEDDKKLDKKLFDFGVRVQEKTSDIDLNSNDYDYYVKVSKSLCDEFYELLDSILGENTSKDIFKGRMYDIEDCISLSNYIREELETQRAKRINKYSTTRIQRDQIKQNFKKRR
ncbi:hypothetical protein [Clostridium thermobutyricum]|uniref:hypothetical protein n=1 Tax=Clostridium thermobutyricum TaxID=29372 RepID=UPI0018AB2944|nr:hypothetical protein [Clostridium thermobutyricum]